MSFIGKRSIDSITIGGQTINGGAVEINMPGSSVDPVTGEITLPTSAGKNIDEFTLDATDISNEYVLVAVAITNKNQTKARFFINKEARVPEIKIIGIPTLAQYQVYPPASPK